VTIVAKLECELRFTLSRHMARPKSVETQEHSLNKCASLLD